MNDPIPFIVGGLILLFTTTLMVDCVGVDNKFYEAKVTGHHYTPPYSTVHCDGKGKCNTIYHHAQYEIWVENAYRGVQINTSKSIYATTKIGDEVIVRYRRGRLTRNYWNETIVRNKSNEISELVHNINLYRIDNFSVSVIVLN